MPALKFPHHSVRALTCGLTIAVLGCLSSLSAHAQTPLSYSFLELDSTGLTGNSVAGPNIVGATGGVVFASSNQGSVAWDLATNTRSFSPIGVRGAAGGYSAGTTVVNGAVNAAVRNLSTGTTTVLSSPGYTSPAAYGLTNGYAVGQSSNSPFDQKAVAWNIATNTMTVLNSSGLTTSAAVAGTNGYAVGFGSGTATGNQNMPMVWNIATNTRISLNSTSMNGLGVYGAGEGYAVGYSSGAVSGIVQNATAWNIATNAVTFLDSSGYRRAFGQGVAKGYMFGNGNNLVNGSDVYTALAWDIASNTRVNLQTTFMPTGVGDSTVLGVGEDGTVAGTYLLGGVFKNYALVPFQAQSGDTLVAGRTARVNSNLTQTTGTTTINGNYTFIGGAGNDTYTLAGGTLQGTGTLTGNLVNTGGILAPGNSPGTFTINGNYTQTSGGVLNMELASSTDFDKLLVSGNATLGGTLNLSFASTFTGVFPASFDLITTGGTITGMFSQVNVIGSLPSGATAYSLLTSSTGSGMKLTLVVVPEVGTLALLGMPLLGMVAWNLRRRKD